jgi:hypothetical protein
VNPERRRGIILIRLDFVGLIETVRQQYDIGLSATVDVGRYDYALAEARDQAHVICSEGVGWNVTAQPLRLPIYVASPGFMALAPQFEIELTANEVRECARPDKLVDLADLIRRFGSRLEDNFWLWHRRLSPVTEHDRSVGDNPDQPR